MKRNKFLALMALIASMVMFSACDIFGNTTSSSDSSTPVDSSSAEDSSSEEESSSAEDSSSSEEHSHEYGEWTITVDPTMDTEGKAQHTCSCDYVEEVTLPVLGDMRVWGRVPGGVEPTCTTEGSMTYTSVYGEVTVVVPATDHSWDEVAGSAADCENSGIKAHYDCANCDEVSLDGETVCTVEDLVIPATGHVTYGEWTITVDPTDETEGSAKRVCSCGNEETAVLPVLGDMRVWGRVPGGVAPTHTTEGSMTYTSVYGEVTVTVPALGHNEYGEWTITVDPTMETEGSAKRVCSCGNEETAVLPVLGDMRVWGRVPGGVAPTHTTEGSMTYTSVYGEVTVTVPALGHNEYGEWTITVDPTMETEGSAKRVCSCGNEETAVLPVLTDASVWTKTAETPADYNNGGNATYTSEYGSVTIATAKLVAPYDSKTYAPINFDASLDDSDVLFKNGVVNRDSAWLTATITLNENGVGIGSAYPFRSQMTITMLDAATGKINIQMIGVRSETIENEDSTKETILVVDPEAEPENYPAYVDMQSGLIVMARRGSFNDVLLLTPFEVGMTTATSSASAWDGSLAIQYTFDGTTYSAYVTADGVEFGVTFATLAGEALAGAECYNAASVVVAKGENVLATFVNNGEKLVVADGLQGTYGEDLVISGCGTLTYAGEAGTYVAIDGGIGAYVGNEYYEIALNGSEYTAVKPMVTLTFDAGEYATVEAIETNKNIAIALPTPTNEQQQFKGWFYDAACENAVEETFIPTESKTLYAKWAPKVIVNLVGVLEGDATVLYLGEGDVIGNFLPVYTVDEATNSIFKGWFLDETFETSLPEEIEVTEGDSGVTIYACWEKQAAYVGTYKGSEIWNASYGNNGGKTLTITADGKMSGTASGIIVSYDPATQIVEWKTNETATTIYKFYFNEKLGIIAGIYSNYDIGNDYYIFSSTDADGKANANYGVKVAKSPTDSTRNYYAQFLNMTTKLGDVEIFLYNNHIYDTFTATDALGNPVTAATVKDAKAVIVKDADGNIIVSVASQGNSFSANNNTVDLDAYFGTYVNGEDTVVLDGTGSIVWGDKTGTYALNENGEYFDIYFANEYYELTLDGASFTMEKPMVTITFDAGEYATIEAITTNKNIAITLPTPEHATNVFNGWYFDADCTDPVPADFIPTEDDTLYALWKVKVTLTVNYNNGAEQGVFVYSVGDTVVLDNPTMPKFKFGGWYTSATFEEGTEWSLGTIEASVEIFAKWEEAPAYYNTYIATRITDTKENGASSSYKYTYTTAITFDAEGSAPGAAYPFGGDTQVTSYDKVTGEIVIAVGTTNYRGYLDSETGAMLLNYTSSNYDNLAQVIYYLPAESASQVSINSSYWNSGLTRVITATVTIGEEVKNYSVFVMEGVVYFGASFENANGEAVTPDVAFGTSPLYVKDSEGNQIAKFGFDGTTMCAMDGYEGTYASGEDTLVVDGVRVVTLNGVAGSYTLAVDAAYTLDAYIDNNYYQITLNTEGYTCTIVRPEVTLTFNAGEQATVDAITTNMNIAIELPQPTNDNYVFRGWYVEGTETLVDINYLPTESVTLIAKWDAKVTLTVVYGNGHETVTLEYGVGDTVAPVAPAFTNGQVFNGWYTDADCTTAYTVGAIEESMTIYCGWMDAVAMYGDYAGFNLYGSGSKNSLYFSAKQSFTADGKASGQKSGTVRDYDAETGIFYVDNGSSTYYMVYDETSGTIAVAYGTNASGCGTDLYVMFKKKATSGEVSENLDGFKKLFTIKFEDGTSENFFFANDRIYSGVTWTADGDYSAYTVGNASTLTVYDRNGEVLFTK